MVDLAPGSVVRVVNPSAVVAYSAPGIVKGIWYKEGPTGPPGRNVTSVVRTAGTGAPGTLDTYTISFSDGDTTTFQIYNGTNGTNGTNGSPGTAGRGIVSIARTSGTGAPGTTDTYTITYTDATTTTFQVVNGANGTGSGDVTGPASSVDNRVALFNGTTGKVIKDSGTLIADLLTTAAAPELIRDTMGTALVAGSNVTITPNDVGDTITIAAAGGGGGGGLLAVKAYVPSASVSTTSTTAVDVDAANNAVPFTVPASGSVLVRLTALISTSAAGGYYFAVREGTTEVASGIATMSAQTDVVVSRPLLITGLTPGAAKTYKFAHKVGLASITGTIRHQSGAGFTMMEVWSA